MTDTGSLVGALRFGGVAAATVSGIWIAEGGVQRRLIGVVVWMVLAIVVVVRAHRSRSARGTVSALIAIAALVAFGLGFMRSTTEWAAVGDVAYGRYTGEAVVVGDSHEVGAARRVILEIDGRRFETWVFGSKRFRVQSLDSGDIVVVDGQRTRIDAGRVRRFHVRHIVGRFEVESMTDARHGDRRSPHVVRAANRVRDAIRNGAQHLPTDRAALFTGLVYGDDSAQPPEMIDRFRRSGLAHLTAVSGQNVSFLLAMLGPLLSRLPRPSRLGITVVVLAWFAVMTRLEPSVVRAVFMAGVTAVAIAAGRPVSSWIALCATVCVATLVDPFLVWSVGWWLSVSGSIGLIAATKPIERALERRPRWLSAWIAPTVAAQAGVLAVIAAVFGWPSAMSIPSNLLAAPVAGAVMLAGLPIAIVAALVPAPVAEVVMWPVGVSVAWVDSVARIGARVDPPGSVDVAVAVASTLFAVRACAIRSRPQDPPD